MKNIKALVVLSGGQDSLTCLYWAMKNYKEVEAISFFYGQNHSIELECSKRVCELEGIKQTFVDISFLPGLVNSALTSGGDVNKINENGLPASFVPNRNALFLTLSHAYAQKIGALHLVTGVCQTDYSGYPDCRENFIVLMQTSLNYGSGANLAIRTPLIFLTKAETFALAKELECLDKIIEYSNTCYYGDRSQKHSWGYGCGKCPACELREKGYKEFINQ